MQRTPTRPVMRAEFWMIDRRGRVPDLKDDMICLAERMLKYARYVLEHAREEEMNFFNNFVDKGMLDRLNRVF